MNKKTIVTVSKKLSKTPKTLTELSNITGYDVSAIKDVIQFLRLEGVTVCSGMKGYWLWNEKDESWNKTIKRLERSYKTTGIVLNAMKNAEHVSVKEVLAEL